jgi:hypothetical protein
LGWTKPSPLKVMEHDVQQFVCVFPLLPTTPVKQLPPVGIPTEFPVPPLLKAKSIEPLMASPGSCHTAWTSVAESCVMVMVAVSVLLPFGTLAGEDTAYVPLYVAE